jgi:hypothetical protein
VPPEIRVLNIEKGKGLSLSTPHYHDFVLWSGIAAPQEDLQAADFEWVWVRRPSTDYPIERAVLLHGSRFSASDLEVAAERPVEFIAVTVQDRELSIDIFPSVGIRVRPPNGVELIAVNGRIHPLGIEKELTVPQHGVPALDLPRDQTDRCKHVWH